MSILAVLVIGIGVLAYWLASRNRDEQRRRPARRALPSSTLGKASLVVMLVGVVVGPVVRNIAAPAPFGVAAFVLAVVAVTKRHDRGLLLVLPLVIGVLMVAVPVGIWIGG